MYEIDQMGNWPSLGSVYSFDTDCQEYTVAVVDGQVWGFLQGYHDASAWMACEMTPTPPENWRTSMVSFLVVHPNARGHGLGAALLRDFMARSRDAGSQWMMMHPAECGAGTRISPAMQKLCRHAGLRLVEPKELRRRNQPSLMAAPLVNAPDYHFKLSTHVPAAQPAARRRSPQRARVLAHAA